MHVCFCFNLTDKKIREHIASSGCRKLSELQRACSAGTNCGGCLKNVRQILSNANPPAPKPDAE